MAGGYSYKLSVRTQQQDGDCCVSVVCVWGGRGDIRWLILRIYPYGFRIRFSWECVLACASQLHNATTPFWQSLKGTVWQNTMGYEDNIDNLPIFKRLRLIVIIIIYNNTYSTVSQDMTWNKLINRQKYPPIPIRFRRAFEWPEGCEALTETKRGNSYLLHEKLINPNPRYQGPKRALMFWKANC